MKRIAENKDLILALSKAKPKLRNAILLNSNTEFIKSILEIIMNTIHGNVNICEKIKKKLKKYKSYLRELTKRHFSFSKKRKILIQHGGFLTSLLTSLIAGALNHIFFPS
jgi:hypothetical protein